MTQERKESMNIINEATNSASDEKKAKGSKTQEKEPQGKEGQAKLESENPQEKEGAAQRGSNGNKGFQGFDTAMEGIGQYMQECTDLLMQASKENVNDVLQAFGQNMKEGMQNGQHDNGDRQKEFAKQQTILWKNLFQRNMETFNALCSKTAKQMRSFTEEQSSTGLDLVREQAEKVKENMRETMDHYREFLAAHWKQKGK